MSLVLVDEAHSLPLSQPHLDCEIGKRVSGVGERCGRLPMGDDVGGQVVVGKRVNFTFADLDAHRSADCLATFKLGHDNEHAT